MAKIKGLIFDFDGLLVNTQELLEIGYGKFLETRGKTLEFEDHATMMGRPALENIKFLQEKYQIEGNPEDLLQERRSLTRVLYEDRMALMKGATELLGRICGWSVKCAIASGGTREIIEPALKKLGISESFSAVVATEDLTGGKGKPDPEIFLIAAAKLGVEPEACLVLGDSANDVAAAKSAGMKVIYVPDARYSDSKNEMADVILENLHGVTEEVLKELEQ